MGKKLMAVLAAAALVLSVFAGCGGSVALSADGSTATDPSNGGFLVETGDFVYFINGNELYTEDNTDGKVEKGALVRVKKSDLGKGKGAAVEVVASKLVSTGDHSAGIYIYGGKIYFATPNNTKNKTGTVLSDEIQFCSVNLDGTGRKVIATATGTAGNSAAFRFVEKDGKVYIVYISTVEETEHEHEDGSVHTDTHNYINVVAADGSLSVKEDYSSYILDKNLDGKYIYFVKSVENTVLDRTETYNDLYRLEIGKDKAELVLSGVGSNRNENANATKGIGGVTFTLIAAENGYVYFSVTDVDTAPTTNTIYAYVNSAKMAAAADAAAAEANYAKLYDDETEIADIMTFNGSSTVFSANSMYVAPTEIIYIDGNRGICVYDYTKEDDYGAVSGYYYGVRSIYYSSDILTASIAYVKGGYLYYHLSGIYYRLPFNTAAAVDSIVAKDAEAEKLSPVTFATDWYAPEVVKVGDAEYVLGTVSSADYFDYVASVKVYSEDELEAKVITKKDDGSYDDAYGIKALSETLHADDEDEDELEDLLESLEDTTLEQFITSYNRENVHWFWNNMIISLHKDNQTAIDEYMDSTYPATTSSESSEGGCSSVMGAGSVLAIAAFAACAVTLKKRG